jgi:branched-chain amino acid transport system substrate-binding protein
MAISRRRFGELAAAGAVGLAAPAIWSPSRAQAQPIRIGCSISMTGPLSGGVKAGLIGYELWRDDVNKAGGILGRQVELVTYDDQSSAAPVPGIYSKLVDVDRVDLLFSPYGANLTAVIMPFVKQRDRFIIGMYGLSNNDVVKHDKFFQIAAWGPNASAEWARSFFDLAKANGVKKVAIIAADAEFSKAAAGSGQAIAKESGMELVLDQAYPPSTTDFSPFSGTSRRRPRMRCMSALTLRTLPRSSGASRRSASGRPSSSSGARWSDRNTGRSWRRSGRP